MSARRADADAARSYGAPTALLAPGGRTARYRVGGDQLLADVAGNSSVSMGASPSRSSTRRSSPGTPAPTITPMRDEEKP